MFVLFKDDPDHARMRKFLHLGFNIEAVRKLRNQIQQARDELLDRVQELGRLGVWGDFAFPLSAYVLSDFLRIHKEDSDRGSPVVGRLPQQHTHHGRHDSRSV